MRVIELKVRSKFDRFVIACPTHGSYGIGITVNESTIDTVIVFGEFSEQDSLNIVTNMDELPLEFILWYSSILVNMKTVNQKQQEALFEPIAAEDIASINGGVFDFTLADKGKEK